MTGTRRPHGDPPPPGTRRRGATGTDARGGAPPARRPGFVLPPPPKHHGARPSPSSAAPAAQRVLLRPPSRGGARGGGSAIQAESLPPGTSGPFSRCRRSPRTPPRRDAVSRGRCDRARRRERARARRARRPRPRCPRRAHGRGAAGPCAVEEVHPAERLAHLGAARRAPRPEERVVFSGHERHARGHGPGRRPTTPPNMWAWTSPARASRGRSQFREVGPATRTACRRSDPTTSTPMPLRVEQGRSPGAVASPAIRCDSNPWGAQRQRLPERGQLSAAGLQLGDHGREPHVFFIGRRIGRHGRQNTANLRLPVRKPRRMLLVAALTAGPCRAVDGARRQRPPASDTLLLQDVFLPVEPPVSSSLAGAIRGLAVTMKKAGYPIKVAIIRDAERPRPRAADLRQAGVLRRAISAARSTSTRRTTCSW